MAAESITNKGRRFAFAPPNSNSQSEDLPVRSLRDSQDGAKTPRTKITTESLREALRLFAYLLPYRVKFVGAIVCLLASGLLGLAFPYFTGRLIDSAQRSLGELANG